MAENKEAPEVTVESLQALVEQETAAHLATKDDLAMESADHETTKGNLASALGALTEASQIIEGQKTLIDEQEAKIIALQIAPAAFPVIEVSKEKYEVRGKTFKYKGFDYTIADLLGNKALQKELVAKGVGFIVKIEA